MSFDLLDKVQISVPNPVALLSFLPFCSYKPEFKSVTQNIKRKVNWTMEYKKNKHLPLLKVCHSKAKRYIFGLKCLMSQITHWHINLAFSEQRKTVSLQLMYDPHREGSLCLMLVSRDRSVPLMKSRQTVTKLKIRAISQVCWGLQHLTLCLIW